MTKPANYYEDYWKTGYHGGEKQGYYQNMLDWMNRELPDNRKLDILLEAGCGSASFSRHLALKTHRMLACDLSNDQIQANREAYPGIEFFAQDLSEPIDVENESVNAIWCSEVLEHLFDPAYAVSEFYRALKPGGKLLITVPYHGTFKNVLIALFKWDEHFAANHPHIRFFTVNTISGVIEKAGFNNIRVETCGMNKPFRDLLIPTNILLSATK